MVACFLQFMFKLFNVSLEVEQSLFSGLLREDVYINIQVYSVYICMFYVYSDDVYINHVFKYLNCSIAVTS